MSDETFLMDKIYKIFKVTVSYYETFFVVYFSRLRDSCYISYLYVIGIRFKHFRINKETSCE